MTEAYIHFLWKLKRLPFHLFKTTDGKKIEICNVGIHNLRESGPDFSNGRIIYDEMEWAGQIEMHLKSSDWIVHKHHLDGAYNNVILHVVYEHDRDIVVEGRVLPTIELKNYIDKEHYQMWQKFEQAIKSIPCEDNLDYIDTIYVKAMIHRALIDRLNRKVQQLLYDSKTLEDEAMLYLLIARAFGAKVNTLPFELLVNELPMQVIKQLSRQLKKRAILQMSGLFNVAEAPLPEVVGHQMVSKVLWKRKGLRPSAFPEKRILQFASLIAQCDFELLAQYAHPVEAEKYMLEMMSSLETEERISENLINSIFINVLVPFYWMKAQRDENEQLQDYVLSFLENLPAENNFIIKKWKSLGVKCKDAYTSQALIELYNEFCSRKKCLHCQIGVKILKGNEALK